LTRKLRSFPFFFFVFFFFKRHRGKPIKMYRAGREGRERGGGSG